MFPYSRIKFLSKTSRSLRSQKKHLTNLPPNLSLSVSNFHDNGSGMFGKVNLQS